MAGPLDASGRPTLGDIQVQKTRMKGMVSGDTWRPPKPEMPGAPQARGGRGKNIAAVAGAEGAAAAAVAEAEERVAEGRQLLSTAVLGGGLATVAKDPGEILGPGMLNVEEADALLRDAQLQLEEARAFHAALASGLGSQWEERAEEERERQAERTAKELEKAKKKAKTPNHASMQTGTEVQGIAKDLLQLANALKAQAGQLSGKADPAKVKEAKATADKVKEAAKEAKVAGKKARDAAKFGSKEEAEAAAQEAREKAEEADRLRREAEDSLAGARKDVGGEDEEEKGPHEYGAWPDCGNPMERCPCDVECGPGEKCTCTVVKGGPPDPAGGGKGRGLGEPLRTGDSVASSDAGSPGAVPKSPKAPEATAGETSAEPGKDSKEPEVPPDTEEEWSDADLENEAKQALRDLGKLRKELENDVAHYVAGIRQILIAMEKRPTRGNQRALEKFLVELSVKSGVLDLVKVTEEGVREAMKFGLESRGEKREEALAAMRRAGWQVPAIARDYLKTAETALREVWTPVKNPDALLIAERQDIETEIERRMYSRDLMRLQYADIGKARTREGIRNEILEEQTRGDAESYASIAFRTALQTVGTVAEVLDTVLGRPARALTLAAGTLPEMVLRASLGIEPPESWNPWERAEPGRFAREAAQFGGQLSGALQARGVPRGLTASLELYGALGGAAGEVLINVGTLGAAGKAVRGRFLQTKPSRVLAQGTDEAGMAIRDRLVSQGESVPLAPGRVPGQTTLQPEGSEVLYRIGTEAESAEKLAADAARAARSKIGVRKVSIHGVSASAEPREGASRALRRLLEEHFPVHDTPTRRNPLHRTIELPPDVTAEVAELFNRLFGRMP